MTKFTAIDPAGKTHTRTSKTRTYTHTVFALPSSVTAVLWANSKEARKRHRENFAYYTEMTSGTSSFLDKRFYETAEQNAERRASAMENAVKTLDGCQNANEYEAKMVLRDLQGIQKRRAEGYYDTYQNMGWCGRADLAQKLKTTTENRNHAWVNVTVVEVC